MCVFYRARRWLIGAGATLAVAGAVYLLTQDHSKSQASPSEFNLTIGGSGYNTELDPVKAPAPEPGGPSSASGYELSTDKTPVPMFGGSPSRNMVNLVDVNIPYQIDKKSAKWIAQLGSRAYGGPTIAGGRIFLGTNNENPRNKRDRGKPTEDFPMGPPVDKGIVMCFAEKDGAFLWQAVHDKLPSGQVHDYEYQGVCSAPAIDGKRAYYVSNRCAVMCVDVVGFSDGNDGPITNEKYQTSIDADFVWEFDMMARENVFPHNLAACSPLLVGDTLFVVTANGVDERHSKIPAPEAPSFMALDKKTGKLLWKNNDPGLGIMHGQWSNPSYGKIKGKPQVIFPGGDGWIRAYEPDTGTLIWKFDANPKDSKYDLGGKGTRSDFIGTPVVLDDKVYIGTGQDPEHTDGIGHFWCIDATKKGDISPDVVTDDKVFPPKTKPNDNSGAIWHYGGEEKSKFARRDIVFGRTMSTACIVDGVVYISDLAGYLHCVDAKTGKRYWQYDLKSNIWGSPYYVDGKVYLADEDGDLFIFKHEKQPVVLDEVAAGAKEKDEESAQAKAQEVRQQIEKKYLLNKIEFNEPIRSTPVVANGTLYVMSEHNLYAFAPTAGK